MELSVAEAASVLGQSQRQVRYGIRRGSLPARKVGGQWRIDSTDLPLSEKQRQALQSRLEVAGRALEEGLRAARKATSDGPEKKHFSVNDLEAFRSGRSILGDARAGLGASDDACRSLEAALVQVAGGCHCFHPADKARRFAEARDQVSTAVAALLIAPAGGGKDDLRRDLVARLEQELLPRIGGLLARHEKRSRKDRFERFGSAPGGSR